MVASEATKDVKGSELAADVGRVTRVAWARGPVAVEPEESRVMPQVKGEVRQSVKMLTKMLET